MPIPPQLGSSGPGDIQECDLDLLWATPEMRRHLSLLVPTSYSGSDVNDTSPCLVFMVKSQSELGAVLYQLPHHT